uniref:F-box domain-containing protein n=1 Tax=Steinernema glaseri TaxID=37863 RepID=A0A1I7YU57_9BILA
MSNVECRMSSNFLHFIGQKIALCTQKCCRVSNITDIGPCSLPATPAKAFKNVANAMDSVPLLFVESVSASLAKESLANLKGSRSAVWQVGAEWIWKVEQMSKKSTKTFIEVCIPDGAPPGYTIHNRLSSTTSPEQLTIDDFCKKRYSLTSMDISPCYRGTEASIEGIDSLLACVNARYLEKLSMRSLHRVDSLFQNFFPLSVNTVSITDCTFGANSAFPEWLRRTLRSDHLQELTILYTTVEGRREDVEQDLLRQLFLCRKSLKINMAGNQNFTNLGMTFFQRVLDLWMNLEKPFTREVRYDLLDLYYSEIDELRCSYFKDGESLHHKSGSGTVTWKHSSLDMTFTP